MTPEEEVQKAQRAQALYDEFMIPFFDETDKNLFDAFKVAINDDLAEIRRQSRTNDAMKAYLLRFIETGKIATIQLKEAKK